MPRLFRHPKRPVGRPQPEEIVWGVEEAYASKLAALRRPSEGDGPELHPSLHHARAVLDQRCRGLGVRAPRYVPEHVDPAPTHFTEGAIAFLSDVRKGTVHRAVWQLTRDGRLSDPPLYRRASWRETSGGWRRSAAPVRVFTVDDLDVLRQHEKFLEQSTEMFTL